MPHPSAHTTREKATELPDVLQFMQLLWAIVCRLDKTSNRITGEHGRRVAPVAR